jgi:flagellar biosynthesis chaperone FliJ
MKFSFRLARVLEWHERKYRIEEARLTRSMEAAAALRRELAQQLELRQMREAEFSSLDALTSADFVAREAWRTQAAVEQEKFTKNILAAEQEVDAQRVIVLGARRKLKLIEKLRDRKKADFDYETSKDLEETAADTWLAGFARRITEAAGEARTEVL